MVTVIREEGDCVIHLEGAMTIVHAAEFQPRILDAVAQGDVEFHVDLSEVEEMDTAGFQLLVMMKRAAKSASKRMRVIAWSPAAHSVVDLFDMFEYFEA